MAKQLKKWQGWLLFGGAMFIIFVLGMLCSSMLERRAEVASVFNNRRVVMTDSIVSQNEKFAEDFPRRFAISARQRILASTVPRRTRYCITFRPRPSRKSLSES